MNEALEMLTDIAYSEGILITNGTLSHAKAAELERSLLLVLDRSQMDGYSDVVTHLAHGLGHFMTDAFYHVDTPLVVYGKCEAIANAWAIRTLCPVDSLKEALRAGHRTPWELAEELNCPQQIIDAALTYYSRKQLL